MGSEGLLAELERVNIVLKGNVRPIDGDILYGNDLIKWQKFANSLYLKLLVKVSNKVDVRTKVSNLLGDPNNRIISSNADNAVLTYLGIAPNRYPLTELTAADFDAVKISESLFTQFSTQKDPRLHVYARETEATINDNSNNTPIYEGRINGVGCNNNVIGSKLGLIYYDYPGEPSTLT